MNIWSLVYFSSDKIICLPCNYITIFCLSLIRRLCRRWGSHKTPPDFFFGRFTSPGSFWQFFPSGPVWHCKSRFVR